MKRVDVDSGKRQWTFLGGSSLPSDPLAREHEKRGRKWLVLSYLFCPCHVPLVMALLGAAFGGTAFGAVLTGKALRVGVVLTSIYALLLWRGFRQIHRAKRIEAARGTLMCMPTGCSVTAPPVRGAQPSIPGMSGSIVVEVGVPSGTSMLRSSEEPYRATDSTKIKDQHYKQVGRATYDRRHTVVVAVERHTR